MASITTVVNKLSIDAVKDIKDSTSPKESQDMTEAKIKAIVTKLQQIEINNGYLGIAKAEEVTKSQVKEIDKARKARVQALTPVELEKVI